MTQFTNFLQWSVTLLTTFSQWCHICCIALKQCVTYNLVCLTAFVVVWIILFKDCCCTLNWVTKAWTWLTCLDIWSLASHLQTSQPTTASVASLFLASKITSTSLLQAMAVASASWLVFSTSAPRGIFTRVLSGQILLYSLFLCLKFRMSHFSFFLAYIQTHTLYLARGCSCFKDTLKHILLNLTHLNF